MPPFLLSDIFIKYFTVGFYKTVVQKQSFIIKQWCKALGWMCSVLVEILVNGVYIFCVFMYKMQIVFFFWSLVLFLCRHLHVRVDVFIYEIGETWDYIFVL